MKIRKLMLGILIMLIAVFCGSYLIHLLYTTWLLFPIAVTAGIIFIVGLVNFITSFASP